MFFTLSKSPGISNRSFLFIDFSTLYKSLTNASNTGLKTPTGGINAFTAVHPKFLYLLCTHIKYFCNPNNFKRLSPTNSSKSCSLLYI